MINMSIKKKQGIVILLIKWQCSFGSDQHIIMQRTHKMCCSLPLFSLSAYFEVKEKWASAAAAEDKTKIKK